MIYSNGPKTARFIGKKDTSRFLADPRRMPSNWGHALWSASAVPSRTASTHRVGIRMLIAGPLRNRHPRTLLAKDTEHRAPKKDARISLSCFSRPLCLCMISARPAAFPHALTSFFLRALPARLAPSCAAAFIAPFVRSCQAPAACFPSPLPCASGHPPTGRFRPVRAPHLLRRGRNYPKALSCVNAIPTEFVYGLNYFHAGATKRRRLQQNRNQRGLRSRISEGIRANLSTFRHWRLHTTAGIV